MVRRQSLATEEFLQPFAAWRGFTLDNGSSRTTLPIMTTGQLLSTGRPFALVALLALATAGQAPGQRLVAGLDRSTLVRWVFVVGARSDCGVDSLAAVERLIAETMRLESIPGLVVGFSKDGCRWVKAYGTADLENGTPMDTASMFRLASVQKTMTAVAVLQLAERGRLDLDAPIQRYVPYFPTKPWPITARELLGHLSGIPHYVDREREQHFTKHVGTREAIAVFQDFDLVAEPGTKYLYSSYGYNLLGAAIEGASGKGYADYLRDHVWAPAGMRDTRMDDPVALIPRRVRGYQRVDGAVTNAEFIDVSSRFAAGGTRGTVPDLLRFLEALGSDRLLTPASRALMWTPMTTRAGERVPYAMGWQIPPFTNRGSLVMNDGGQPETRTFILSVPDQHFAMALAMNLEADVYAPIVFKVVEAALGLRLVRER